MPTRKKSMVAETRTEAYGSIEKVVKTLDTLRKDAENTGDEDMALLIESAFNICFTAYHTALRMKLMERKNSSLKPN
jgi:hypothetical protein